MFEDYGDNDNDIYLKYHGFVTLENPFDCVKLKVPACVPVYLLTDTYLPTYLPTLLMCRAFRDVGGRALCRSHHTSTYVYMRCHSNPATRAVLIDLVLLWCPPCTYSCLYAARAPH